MAVPLGFGVMFATLITLVRIPAAYVAPEDIRRAIARLLGTPLTATAFGADRA